MNEIILFLENTEFNWDITEIIAVIFSVIYVILAANEKIWCWIAAIISVSCYIYICFINNLYAETALQVFYLIMAFYGYYNWNNNKKILTISEWNISKHILIIISGTIAMFIMGFYLTIYTNAKIPIIDSFTTVFSVIATFMVTKKILGNWLYWIIINITSIYMYYDRELILTALLFIIYTIIALFGYIKWVRLKQDDKNNTYRA